MIETGIEALVLDATDMFLQLVPHTSASEVSLDSYAARVCEVPAADSEPAVLVGHSMGGIVATKGAARCPERIAALVDTNKTLKRKANPSL